MSIAFCDVGFTYDRAAAPVLRGVTFQCGRGWTGIIGANGAGKTTLLRLACGELTPDHGSVRASGPVAYCAQRTDGAPPRLAAFLAAVDAEAWRLRGVLGVAEDWASRWHTLSHGERKRCQIAVALWQEPAVLALDEPTNHIDAETRAVLQAALAAFCGSGLLVSHDRDLLDALCSACIVIEPPVAVWRRGNYSEVAALLRQEEESRRQVHEEARQELRRLDHTARERRHQAAQADRKRSKRGLDAKDHDARERIDRARVSGKDGQAGRLLRQLQGRLQQSEARLDDAVVKKEYALGIWLANEVSRRDSLLLLQAGSVALGEAAVEDGGTSERTNERTSGPTSVPVRQLAYPRLSLGPRDRVAITGPNGAGKSTFVRMLLTKLDLPADKLVYVPQEISAAQSRDIIDQVRDLGREELGRVMTIVSRLGSRPQRLMVTEQPSPGEIRKILLALGIARAPHLIIMDEPTNHLDLPAITCLEDALAECPGALVLVSHDQRFLRRLTQRRWHIAEGTLTVSTE